MSNTLCAFGAGGSYVGATNKDDVMQAAIAAFNKLKAAYEKAGISGKPLSWLLVQDWMESGAFSNKGYKLYNNPGNIMWNKNDKYGTKGGYNAANKTYWSKYPNLDAYVSKKLAVMHQAPGHPIDAADFNDFVHRLKLNNYFGPISEKQYADAMTADMKTINLLGDYETDSDQEIVVKSDNDSSNPLIEWWDGLSLKEKVIGGVGAGLLVLIIARR